MIVWTLKAFEAFLLLTWHRLICQGMELLLLPAMTVLALVEPLAALLIAGDKGATLPVLTEFNLVVKQVRSPPEVLEIVCVDTLGLVMLMVEGTPLCLEVEHVEVEVTL